MSNAGIIYGVNGASFIEEATTDLKSPEMVYVGPEHPGR